MTDENRLHPYSNRGAENTTDMGLRACVDWFQATLPGTSNPLDVINLLGLSELAFEPCETGKYGYRYHLRYHHIAIYYDEDLPSTHIEMTGQGCREYEQFSKLTWSVLFSHLLMLNVSVARLDIAIDDFKGYFKIPTLYKKFRQGHVRSKFKQYNYRIGGTIGKKDITGQTLYVGSMKSRLYVRIYDKLAERISKGIQIEEGITCWNRTELQLRDSRADTACLLIANEKHEVGQLVAGILKNYINFINPTKTTDGSIHTNKARWNVSKFWTDFLGNVEPIGLTEIAPDKTIETTKKWVEGFVTPSLATLMEALDYDEELIHNWIIDGKRKMTKRHWKMIENFKQEQIKRDFQQNIENPLN